MSSNSEFNRITFSGTGAMCLYSTLLSSQLRRNTIPNRYTISTQFWQWAYMEQSYLHLLISLNDIWMWYLFLTNIPLARKRYHDSLCIAACVKGYQFTNFNYFQSRSGPQPFLSKVSFLTNNIVSSHNVWLFQDQAKLQIPRIIFHAISYGLSDFLGLYSLSGKTSYRKISWSLEAAIFGFQHVQSLWNLTGTSAAMLPRCLLNFRAILSL